MSNIVKDLLAAASRYNSKISATVQAYDRAKAAAEAAGYRVKEPGKDPRNAFATTTAFLQDEPEKAVLEKTAKPVKTDITHKDQNTGVINGKN